MDAMFLKAGNKEAGSFSVVRLCGYVGDSRPRWARHMSEGMFFTLLLIIFICIYSETSWRSRPV